MDFYHKNKSKGDYEPDLRQELKDILFKEKRGSYFVYRRVRRNEQGSPVLASSTTSNRSLEATFGTNSGMRYLFDDHLIVGYMSTASTFHDTGTVKEYGDSRTDKNTLFLQYDFLYNKTGNLLDLPDVFDKILVPYTDLNGNLISPLKTYLKYDIGSSENFRLDSNGRIEFFKLNLISNMDDSIQL